MEFIEIGDRLKSERTRRNLSMEQVMADTKLSRSNLEAMEAGDFNRLPHPVYAKGFVRNYANYLGLDGEELASYLDELIPGQKQDQDRDGLDSFDVPDVQGSEKKKSWPSIVLLFVLAAVMVGLVFYFSSGKDKARMHDQAAETQEHAAVPQAEEPPVQHAVEDAVSAAESVARDVAEGVLEESEVLADQAGTSEPAMTGETAGETSAQGADALAQAGQAAESAAGQVGEPAAEQAEDLNEQAELAVAPDAVTADQEVEQVPVAVNPQGNPVREAGQKGVGKRVFSLIAKPNDASWMQVRIDDGPVKEYILRDGAGMNFNFADTLYIRLGNGGGVTAYLDGKDYPIEAEKGQVRTLIIPE